MALTDVDFKEGIVGNVGRGNVGVLTDIEFTPGIVHRYFETLPAVGDVKGGVLYGRQGSGSTGTYSPPSGASDYAF